MKTPEERRAQSRWIRRIAGWTLVVCGTSISVRDPFGLLMAAMGVLILEAATP